MRSTAAARLRGRAGAAFFGTVVTLTDLLTPRVRYGYVHRVTRAVFRGALPSVQAENRRSIPTSFEGAVVTSSDLTCILAADHLDVGGIGSVIEMLAQELGSACIRPVIVCRGDGTRAARLRKQGIEVVSVEDMASAAAAIGAAGADVVQLHSAPPYLEQAAILSGLPIVTVMHNTEIHFTRARWMAFTHLLERSVAGVAVSETVRGFHARHVSDSLAERIVVIPNGAPRMARPEVGARRAARTAIATAVGIDIGEDLIFVCLARYDAQKNVAGTVSSFLKAAEKHNDIRLVYAGDPSDWAELRRADGIRRSSPHGDRIHLLANSDAATLLTAADAFVLDSFFEGWPVAATEAAAAGLPLLLSDVGGARELVARDSGRSVLIANATGEASQVSDARVRVARRASKRQSNEFDFVLGVRSIAEAVRRGDRGTVASDVDRVGASEMMRAHAALLRSAARRELAPTV